ncbi:MAG: DUF4234 domain-containing protein [Acutalibacteraceae bacterium]|nr:DUF4234 domain-containing protein [Acutalibacteraceae bacterium]
MNFILSLVIAIGITILLKKSKFLQNADAKSKKLIVNGVWVRFVLRNLGYLFYSNAYIFEGGEDIPKYLGFFISDFSPIGTYLVIIGIILGVSSIVSANANKAIANKELNDDENILFSGASQLADKIKNICQKVVKFGSIIIVVLNIYDAINSVWYGFKDFNVQYADVNDIYYIINDIPYAIVNSISIIAVLILIITLVCLFVRNELTVTNKRVYGLANFSKKFDVDFEKLTSVDAKGNNGIVIGMGLNSINLWSIENSQEAIALIKPNVKEIEQETIVKGDEKPMITINPLLKQMYRKLSWVAVLSVLTFGIYQFVWIYKMTNALNLVDDKEQRNPTNKLLLCLFIPMYTIWWFYKSISAVKKLEDAAGIKSDVGVLCPVFALLCPLIATVMLQDSLNKIIED